MTTIAKKTCGKAARTVPFWQQYFIFKVNIAEGHKTNCIRQERSITSLVNQRHDQGGEETRGGLTAEINDDRGDHIKSRYSGLFDYLKPVRRPYKNVEQKVMDSWAMFYSHDRYPFQSIQPERSKVPGYISQRARCLH